MEKKSKINELFGHYNFQPGVLKLFFVRNKKKRPALVVLVTFFRWGFLNGKLFYVLVKQHISIMGKWKCFKLLDFCSFFVNARDIPGDFAWIYSGLTRILDLGASYLTDDSVDLSFSCFEGTWGPQNRRSPIA